MKKFFKITGIVIASIAALTIIAGVIGAIFSTDIDHAQNKEDLDQSESIETIETSQSIESADDESEPIKSKPDKKLIKRFNKIKSELETVSDSMTFNNYFSEIEEMAKTDTTANNFLKYKEDYRFGMEQRQLSHWVEHAKKEYAKQFSDWDGSNKYLVTAVKKAMKNPASFKHVETKFDYGSGYSYIRVYMTYRGTNAYNAVVTEKNS